MEGVGGWALCVCVCGVCGGGGGGGGSGLCRFLYFVLCLSGYISIKVDVDDHNKNVLAIDH